MTQHAGSLPNPPKNQHGGNNRKEDDKQPQMMGALVTAQEPLRVESQEDEPGKEQADKLDEGNEVEGAKERVPDDTPSPVSKNNTKGKKRQVVDSSSDEDNTRKRKKRYQREQNGKKIMDQGQ